jgi:hypothetical protein
MYRPTDTFDHERHVVAGGGRASCAGCHLAPGDPKTRAASKSCDACHPPVASARTRVRPASADAAGLAASYQEAMHGLCIACHEEHERTAGVPEPHLSRCATCHRPELDRLRPTPEISPLTVASGPSRRMNP